MGQYRIGLQMYSVKQSANKDLIATLAAIKEMGYDAIELTSYFTFKPYEVRKHAKRLGLQIPSIHIPLRIYDEQKIKKDFERSAEAVAQTGSKYVVIPWLPIRESLKSYELNFLQQLLHELIIIAEQYKLQLVIHHYSREFNKLDTNDQQEHHCFMLDRLLEPFTEQQVQLELDFYSLYVTGLNPFEIYERYEQRTPFVHLRTVAEGRKDCLLEHGAIDFANNLHNMTNLQSKVLYIEQQSNEDTSIEDAQKNFAYISQLLQSDQQSDN